MHLLPMAYTVLCTALACAGFANNANASPFQKPPVQSGANIGECSAKLEQLGGGWCEIRHSEEAPSISSVWPADLDKETRMVVGPRAVLIAWNGAAYDEADGLMYFMGGGHRDYGGNEVYEFNLETGKWARLTDPSPLDYLYKYREATASKGAVYCRAPDMRRVPGAAHSYDGVQFSKKTRTIFLLMLGAANGTCFEDEEGKFKDDPNVLFGSTRGRGIFEFNPSRTEDRNGLAPLTWRRVYGSESDPNPIQITYARSAELPDGTLLVGDRRVLYRFDPVTASVGKRAMATNDRGDGLSIYDPSGAILTLYGSSLVRTVVGAPVSDIIDTPAIHGKSLAIDKEGRVFSWNGGSRILTIDLHDGDRKWRLYNWQGAGPSEGDRRVYSKWQYVASHDVFVGLSIDTTGVWVYKHPDAMPGTELAEADPQALVKQALAGSKVTIPPGLYTQGLIVDKSLTLELKGARFWGVAKHKGIINVKCNNCSVTIEDLHAEGREANCLGGNCAGIKVEGENFELAVKRAHIDNTVMGILTDNRGGRLVIEDSVIENIGLDDSSREIAHGLYAGMIDELVLRDTTIRNVNGDGHLLKSRARKTVLENVRLLGEEGYHSRSIDLPCGGSLQVSNSVIQHGKNTDNADIIAVGTEPKNCDEIPPTTIDISNSWLIIDRDRSPDERAHTYGPNFLFRWRAPLQFISMKNNRIVNIEEWSTTETDRGDVTIPDLSADNKMCRTRSECGLSSDGLPGD